MNFTHLFAFFEVARAGSISAGAERLHVSQPAVTWEIRELEDRFELALFDRLPRGVRLTDAGTILLRYAEQIFSLADAAEWELKELAERRTPDSRGKRDARSVFSARTECTLSLGASSG